MCKKPFAVVLAVTNLLKYASDLKSEKDAYKTLLYSISVGNQAKYGKYKHSAFFFFSPPNCSNKTLPPHPLLSLLALKEIAAHHAEWLQSC